MGEAKEKAKTKDVVTEMHIKPSEQWALLLYLVTDQATPKNRHEGRRQVRAFEELGLTEFKDLVEGGKKLPDGTLQGPSVVVKITRDTIDYILEVTDRPMSTMVNLQLNPLEERLLSVREGVYSLPSELVENAAIPTVTETPSAAPIEA